MKAAVLIRPLTPSDLPFADTLRAIAGWNQTLTDWERFLALQPDGCFLAELDRSPAGVATTLIYSGNLAWVGMLLVHPDFRRRGVGRALFDHSVQYARECGVPCVKLDATPEGKPLYMQRGFHEEWTLTRWECVRLRSASLPCPAEIRAWRPDDMPAVNSLDAPVFGASRATLIHTLARHSRRALVFESAPGKLAGYGLLRAGSRAAYLGPVVAADTTVGRALIQELLPAATGEKIFWDIPDQNYETADCARDLGFTIQRPLTRMYLGINSAPGQPRCQLAIAGPELG